MGIAHSFCSDFKGMNLWESSSIEAPAQSLDVQSCSLHHRQPVTSIMSAVRSGQSRAMGQEVQSRRRALELGCHGKSPGGESVV